MDVVNILIVDDREANIIALQELLDREDVSLITTTSPKEALKLCQQKEIAIALVDVQMPEMDGLQLVEILKSNPQTRDILVIFITAISNEPKYTLKGLSVGAVDYLYKPLDSYVTAAKVDSFIQLARAQSEIKRKNRELESYQAELLAAKQRAEQAKKAKERFLADMSHEIRTPINSVLGLAHLLKGTPLNGEQKKLISLLEVSGESLLGLVNDILDISKIEAGKFKIIRTKTDIKKITTAVSDLLRFKAEEKNLELRLELDDRLPQNILVDALRLNQILLNLLSNAIKFTEKGWVSLNVNILLLQDKEVTIEFCVKDTGIGIPPNKLNKIFDSFEQADDDTSLQYGGTGLGLSIVKNLSELKNGILKVESKEGEGSAFSFINTFNIMENMPPTASNPEVALPKFINVSVLLAEDDPINQFMVKKMLNNWNIEVDAVDDGTKALKKLQEKNYHLILMDTYMPKLNGYETIRQIRTTFSDEKKDIPIISLSANILEEEMQAALNAGANDVLSKPFEASVLHGKIEKAIAGKKSETASS